MHPAITKPHDGFWFRRTLLSCGAVFGVLVVYALSLGPVLKLCGAKTKTGWNGLPVAVRFIYAPLRGAPEPLAGALDHYVRWWVGGE